jgi:hypothetical protein
MVDGGFDVKYDYFDNIKTYSGFKSTWSIYKISSVYALSDLEAENLVYEDHWGKRAVSVPLPGGNLMWWDLWLAAEKAIIESKDMTHVFIEDFQMCNDGKTIFLRTGS